MLSMWNILVTLHDWLDAFDVGLHIYWPNWNYKNYNKTQKPKTYFVQCVECDFWLLFIDMCMKRWNVGILDIIPMVQVEVFFKLLYHLYSRYSHLLIVFVLSYVLNDNIWISYSKNRHYAHKGGTIHLE